MSALNVADDILWLMTYRHLMFTASFETRSAMQVTISAALGRFRKIFAVEIAQRVVLHCQDKDAGFYGLIRKEFTKMDF